MEMSVPYRVHSEYRKKVLYGKVREDVRDIISTLCKYKDVDIIAGTVCVNYVYPEKTMI